VVNGRKRKPRHGMMNELKARFIIPGRAIQKKIRNQREKLAATAVRHPELLVLVVVLISKASHG
jgi:hypothetical protein